ncbi:MAG TPA: YgaP-like transmembrane domain [Tepidisphaeraceae bacterium]|jgi:heme A synthase|nr:YgaP-like transmembrane domain [Tepidisphaeraceae bacterium]
MQCNINSRGRRTRLISGIISCILAITPAVSAATTRVHRPWLAAAAIALLLVGIFQIFEGVKGWCALRAMGIRTRS